MLHVYGVATATDSLDYQSQCIHVYLVQNRENLNIVNITETLGEQKHDHKITNILQFTVM